MASLHIPIVKVRTWSKEQGIVSQRTKLYMHDGLGRERVYAENGMVYGKVYKQNYKCIQLPLFLIMARACVLTELQWRSDHLFAQTLIDGLGTGRLQTPTVQVAQTAQCCSHMYVLYIPFKSL